MESLPRRTGCLRCRSPDDRQSSALSTTEIRSRPRFPDWPWPGESNAATSVPGTMRVDLPEAVAVVVLRSLHSLVDSDRQTIDEITAALPAGWPVDAIVLYGSKARGDDTPDSDIDLLVLTGRPLSPEETGRMREFVRASACGSARGRSSISGRATSGGTVSIRPRPSARKSMQKGSTSSASYPEGKLDRAGVTGADRCPTDAAGPRVS